MISNGVQSPGGGTGHRRSSERPDHFSTYAPREVIRGLKVIAAIRDVPLWAIVTDALRHYIQRFEREHGRLPNLASPSSATEGKEL